MVICTQYALPSQLCEDTLVLCCYAIPPKLIILLQKQTFRSISHFLINVEKKKAKKVQLSEFFDVSEFQIGDNKKYECHDSQSHVILPQAPAGVLYSQVVQILLPCTSKKNTSPCC